MGKERIKKIGLFILIIVLIFQMIRLRNFPINNIFIIVFALIILLADFKESISFYRNKILIVLTVFHILISIICMGVYSTNEYGNLLISYLKVSVFQTTTNSLISKPDGVTNFVDNLDKPTYYARRNNVDSYRYMIEKKDTVEEKMKLISTFLFEIVSYEHVYQDSYSVRFKVNNNIGAITIIIKDYSQFSILQFK